MNVFDPALGHYRPVRGELEAFRVAAETNGARMRARNGDPLGSGTPMHARNAYDDEKRRINFEKSGTSGSSYSYANTTSEQQEHVKKGGNFYRGIPVPKLTEEEKREKVKKEKQKAIEAEKRRIESSKSNADDVMHLIKTHLESGELQNYLKEKSSNELGDLLHPFKNHLSDDQSESDFNQRNINLLVKIYNSGILHQTLSNPDPNNVDYRKNWRRFLEKVENNQYEKAPEKIYKSPKRLQTAEKNKKITFGKFIGATIKSSVIGLAIFFGGKALLDKNGGSLIGKTQCVTSDIGVNIRTEPSSWQSGETVIARIPFQTAVKTTGSKINNDWLKATTNYGDQKITGYVHSAYLGACPK